MKFGGNPLRWMMAFTDIKGVACSVHILPRPLVIPDVHVKGLYPTYEVRTFDKGTQEQTQTISSRSRCEFSIRHKVDILIEPFLGRSGRRPGHEAGVLQVVL
jgi:hypothetical protein